MKRRSFIQAMLGLMAMPTAVLAAHEELHQVPELFDPTPVTWKDTETGEEYYILAVNPQAAEMLRMDAPARWSEIPVDKGFWRCRTG